MLGIKNTKHHFCRAPSIKEGIRAIYTLNIYSSFSLNAYILIYRVHKRDYNSNHEEDIDRKGQFG